MDNEFYKECLLIEYAAYYRKHDILAALLVGKDASRYSQVPILGATLSSIIEKRAVERFEKAVDILWELYEFASDLIPFEHFGYLLIDIIFFKILAKIKECGGDDDDDDEFVNDILGLCRIPRHVELDCKDRKWLQERYEAISTKLIFAIHNDGKVRIFFYFKRLVTCNCFFNNIKERVNMYLDKVNEKFGPPGLESFLRLNGKQSNKQKRKQADVGQSSSSTESSVINPFISRSTLTERLTRIHSTKGTAAICTEKEQVDAEQSSSITEKDHNLFKSGETLAKTVRSNCGKDSAAICTGKEQGDAEKSSSSTEKDHNLFKSGETLAKTVRSNCGKDSAAICSGREQGDAEKSSSSTEKDHNLFKSGETLAKTVRSNCGKDSASFHTENKEAGSEQSSSEKNLNHFTSMKTPAKTITSYCEKNTAADIHAENLNTDAEVSSIEGLNQLEIDEGQQREILSQTNCPCGFSNSEKDSQESESSFRDVVGAFNNGICSEIYDPRDCKVRWKEDHCEESDDENDCSSILSECFDIVEQTNSHKETDNLKDINKLSDNVVCGENFDGGSDCSMLSECFDMVEEMDNFNHDEENNGEEAECTIFSNGKSKKDDRHEFEESESKDDAQVLNDGSFKNVNKRSDREVCRKNDEQESQESECSMLSECFDIVKQSDDDKEMHGFSHDENVISDVRGAKEQVDRMSQSCDSVMLFDSYNSEGDDGQELETGTSISHKQSDSKESCFKPLDNNDSSICSMDIDERNKLIGKVDAGQKVDNMDPPNQRSSNNDLISNKNDTTNLLVRTTSSLQAEEDFPDLVNQPSSNDLPTQQTHKKDEPSSIGWDQDIGCPKHVNNKQKKIVATVKPLVKITDVRGPADHSIRACRLNDEKHTTTITDTSIVLGADGQGKELEQSTSSENDLSSLSRRSDVLNTLEIVIQAFNHACSAMVSPKDNNNNDKTNEKNASNCLPSGSAHPPLTTTVHSPNIWQCTTINSQEILSSLLFSLEELYRLAGLSEQTEMTDESTNNSCVIPTKLPQCVVTSEIEKLSRNEPDSCINEDQLESNAESCEGQPNDRHLIDSQQRVKTVFSSKEGTKEVLHVSKVSEATNQLGGKGDDESTSVASLSANTHVCSLNQNPYNSSDNVERTFRNLCLDHCYSVITNSKEAVDVRNVSANKNQLGGKSDSLITKDPANDESTSVASQNLYKSSDNVEETFRSISHDHCYSVNTNSEQEALEDQQGPEPVDVSKVSPNKDQQSDDQENDESTSACCSANSPTTSQNPHKSSDNLEGIFRNISHDHNYFVNTSSSLKKVPEKHETSSGEPRISAQTTREKEHEESILNISHDRCSSANDASNLDLNRKRRSTSKLSPQLSKKRANKDSQPGVFTSNGNILLENKGLNVGVQSDTGKSFESVCACSNGTAQDGQSIDAGKPPVIKVEKTDSTTSLTRVLPCRAPLSGLEPKSSESVPVLGPSNLESEENRSSVKSPSIFDLCRPTSLTQDEAVCSCSENSRWSSNDESSLDSQRNFNAVDKANTSDSIRYFVPVIKKENVEEPTHQIIDEFKDCSEIVGCNPTECSDLTRNSNALALKKDAGTDMRSSWQLSENPGDCSSNCTGLLTSNEHLSKPEDLIETSEHSSKSSNLKIMRSYKRKNFHGNTRTEPNKRQEINFLGSNSEVRTPHAHAAVPSNFKDHSSEDSNFEAGKDSEISNSEESEISVASKHNSDKTYEPSDSEASENFQISSYEPSKSSENSNFGESETTGVSQYESDETYMPSDPEVCESSTTSDSEPCENSEISSFEPSKNSKRSVCRASRTAKTSKFEPDKTHKPLNLKASDSSDASDSEPSENFEKSSVEASENSEMTNFWESESSGNETYNPSNFEKSETPEISDSESSKTSEISNFRGRKNSKKSDFKWSTTTKASNFELRPTRDRRFKQKLRVKKTSSLLKYKITLEAVVKLEKFEMESLQRTGIVIVHK